MFLIDDSGTVSFAVESSIWMFIKSRASSSTEIGRFDTGSGMDSSTGAGASFHVVTVWPFARRIGRFSSAYAGRGGVGIVALLLASKVW